ncbi:MAG: 16S rRNA (uracil(1498)-N(3))-methyltransferase [Gammaproteobacteria bacterium]|nr:16S rRNA (uracil(1498)-N(3))-methyltransferase [Gammaproteobacteria bacterium]
MRLPRFYTPQSAPSSALGSGMASATNKEKISIDGSVARHMAQVLRLKVGSPVILFNGGGGEYRAVIRSIAKQSVILDVEAFNDRDVESGLKIILAQGVSRGERMDYTMQKATELGVTEIIPINTQRTVVNLKGDRSIKRLNHWQKIVSSACEQCGRNIVPQVAQVDNFRNWIAMPMPTLIGVSLNDNSDNNSDNIVKILLHHEAQQSISSLATSLSDLTVSSKKLTIVLLIGSEGGISAEERDLAIQAGFKLAHLGPRVLRTETAAVVALSILQSTLGDLC